MSTVPSRLFDVDTAPFMRLCETRKPEPFIVCIGDFPYAITTGPVAIVDHARRLIVVPVASHDLTRAVADGVCRAWRERLDMYAESLRKRWDAFELVADVLADPDFEPSEDGGPEFVAAFDELVRMGIKFDPRFVLLIKSWKNTERIDIDFAVSDYMQSHLGPPHVVAWYQKTERASESFVEGGLSVDDGFEDDSNEM